MGSRTNGVVQYRKWPNWQSSSCAWSSTACSRWRSSPSSPPIAPTCCSEPPEGIRVPTGYRIEFGGQFEEANESARRLGWLALAVLLAVWGILWLAFRDHRQVAIVLVNLLLALVGGVAALALTSATLSIASMVAFVTLFGVATRNGVLLVSHYRHLMAKGAPLEEPVRNGSRERLAPVLMTALTAALALIPLALAGDQPGNEIQSPVAVVILGGLLTSTFLNLLVVPVLFRRFGAGAR